MILFISVVILAIIEGKLKKKHGTIKNHLDESKTQMVYIANNGKGKLWRLQIIK